MSTYFNNKEEINEGSLFISKISGFTNYYFYLNDKIQPYKLHRWLVILVMFLFYILRLYLTRGNVYLYE